MHTHSSSVAASWFMASARPLLLCAALTSSGQALGRSGHDRVGCDERGCEHAKVEWLELSGNPETIAGFDTQTGRDERNFPRDRVADFLHMKLELTIPDMDVPRAQGKQTLRIAPIAYPLSTLTLDARAMTISRVSCEGHSASFTHDGRVLSITFGTPVPAGLEATLVIEYALDDPPRGLIWTPTSDAWAGRAAQLHTQGQPETNSYWLPCHDFPNERLTTEVLVTVPEGFLASSNGTLLSRTRAVREVSGVLNSKRLAAFETFHFLQDKPHANYLVSLVVGKFDVVDVGDGTLPLPVYVPAGRGKDVKGTYGNTLAMIRLYERLFDEPYPWSRYAQIVASNFEAGGMENTSVTTMHENAVFSASAQLDHDMDGLIAHELGHQWFGDLITCNSWEHIWLNEGFATYLEALWFEQRDGEEGYVRDIQENYDRVLASDTGISPQTVGMASKVYEHPWETFRRGANPYPKGASILHMLRRKLGDEVFFGAMREYVEQQKLRTVQTFQLRQAFEARSGRQLEQFFQQWCMRPGTPRINVSWTYDPTRSKLRFSLEQTQTIDADNPAFEFTLPIFIKNSAGPDVLVEPFLFSRSDTFEVDLEGPPRFVSVDPHQHVLAKYAVTQDPAMWLAGLRDGPSLAARVQAARALAGSGESAASEALRRIANDAKEPRYLRLEAIKALGARGNAADVRALVSSARDHWEVRQAVTEALATLCTSESLKDDATLREFAVRTLSARAVEDPSLKVRDAALGGLGAMKAPEALVIAREALNVSSQGDSARQAALSVLAQMAPADALSLAIAYAQEGWDGRTRAAAIGHIVTLASTDRERAFKALTTLVNTRENRPRMAAAAALADLGDARGVQVLRTAEETSRAPEIAARIARERERLEKKLAGG
jgi:aminopeptidase N